MYLWLLLFLLSSCRPSQQRVLPPPFSPSNLPSPCAFLPPSPPPHPTGCAGSGGATIGRKASAAVGAEGQTRLPAVWEEVGRGDGPGTPPPRRGRGPEEGVGGGGSVCTAVLQSNKSIMANLLSGIAAGGAGAAAPPGPNACGRAGRGTSGGLCHAPSLPALQACTFNCFWHFKNRITNSLRLEKVSKIPNPNPIHPNHAHIPQCCSPVVLNSPRDGDQPRCQGSLCQFITSLLEKKLFLCIQPKHHLRPKQCWKRSSRIPNPTPIPGFSPPLPAPQGKETPNTAT